jgi:hypothetical protein
MNYTDKLVLLASKHNKEEAIGPVFRRALACNLCVEDINTDQFGTFTGEVPRSLSAYETCILKARYAAHEKKYALSVASEGSFGPHPSNPFIPHAHEIMVFVDLEKEWIISERLLTTNTNYKMMTIDKNTLLDPFLKSALFPSHALTLQSADRLDVIAKGINAPHQLQASLSDGFKKYNELFIATDMRAMMNPTRMQTIGELAEKLAIRIKSHCSGCGVPGFGFKSVSGHLPCSLCGDDTKMYRYEEWGCIQCDYQEQRPRKDHLIVADPTHCDYCNP